MYAVQTDEAVAAYRRGGAPELAAFTRRLDEGLRASHHLTDAAGRDLATGADLGGLLALTPPGAGPRFDADQFVAVHASADGQYRLIVTGAPPFTTWDFVPFYLLVLASIALVSWWVARSIVPPIRTMASVADRFGRGDLAVRVAACRRRVGTLAAAFNDMARRIQTLLEAERRLLQDISHELRSPLARLNFWSSWRAALSTRPPPSTGFRRTSICSRGWWPSSSR